MKKSFKKLLFVVMALLSLSFIVSCGNKLSKKEVVEKFIENTKTIKSMDIAMIMKMEQKNSTSPASVTMEASANISMNLEPFAMKINMSIPFSGLNLEAYMKDNYMYIYTPDTKQWSKQVNKDFDEQLKKSMAEMAKIRDFVMKNIDKIDLKEKDGTYILILNNMENIMKNEFSAMNIPAGELNMMKDFTLTQVIDKKTFLPISFTMTGLVEAEGVKMNIAFEQKYSNINNIKEIVIPEEALNAKEITVNDVKEEFKN